jgi:hypothetical protein
MASAQQQHNVLITRKLDPEAVRAVMSDIGANVDMYHLEAAMPREELLRRCVGKHGRTRFFCACAMQESTTHFAFREVIALNRLRAILLC